MKKIYLPIVAIATMLCFAVTVVAQRPKITFNGSASSRWSLSTNWTVSAGPVRTPTSGDSIVIPTGQSAYIAGTDPSFTLSNVIIVVQTGGTLTIGNGSGGGSNAGTLTLDNASVISLEYSGTGTRSKLISNTTTNTNNSVVLGGVTKFQGNLDYTTSLSATSSGVGFVNGPAKATASTGSGVNGFTFGSLPVVLVGFNANLTSDNKVNIEWSTQQEINSDRFEILHSTDGITWQSVATVKASGYSSVPKHYSATDAAPQKGVNLYQLKMIDLDGKYGLSSVVNVRLNSMGRMSVFPNPTVNSVTVSLSETPSAEWSLSLINISGQIVLQKKFSKDQTIVSLPVSHFPTGQYTLEINDGLNRQHSKLMIAHQ